MSRRRFLSTEISVDANVARLAAEAGEFAALLYTWLIPHAEDDGTVRGEPGEILLRVIPGLRHRTEEDVAQALAAMEKLGLILWDRVHKVLRFPPESFHKYQTYIPSKKRLSRPSDKDNSLRVSKK